jgi:hypothetical protein
MSKRRYKGVLCPMANRYRESTALYFITEMKDPPLLVDILLPRLLLFYNYAFDTSNSN